MTSQLPTARRFDLDWLRIGAFGLLILYHTGMFYVTWDWHVKSRHASSALEPMMLLVNPWRLQLLFLVSGVATRYMADRMSPGTLARSRFHRLFWPLIFAMMVIVPPQAYLEIVSKIAYPDGYLDFYPLYLSGYHGWCRGQDCLIVPTWNHMWFVAYLLVYSLILSAILPLARHMSVPLTKLRGVALVVLPWLYLWACRYWLMPIFGQTHALVDDVYLHAIYLPLFLVGFAIAKAEAPFVTAQAWRHGLMILGLTCYAALMVLRAQGDEFFDATWWTKPVGRGLHELQAWTMILSLIGYARTHLANADGPWRRWLTRAVFPFYVVHQTIIVVAAFLLDRLDLPLALEGALVVAAVLAGCLIAASAAMRWSRVGLLLGVTPQSRA